MGLDSIQNGLENIRNVALTPVGAAVGGAIVGGAITGATVYSVTRSKKKRRSARSSKRKKSKARSSKRRRRSPRTAGRGKDRSTKRIRYTKNGQPYVITRSGRAKFIKMSSARRSHRQKGGRY